MTRRPIVLLLVAVSIGALISAAGCGGSATKQDYVVRVNDKLFTATDVAAIQETRRRAATAVAQVATVDPDPHATPVDRSAATAKNLDRRVIAQQLIEDELFFEEAQRRHLTCSDEDMSANLDYRLLGGDLTLIVALGTYVPKDYLQTPAGKRTTFEDARDAYVADPKALSEAKHQCQVSKLCSVLGMCDDDGRCEKNDEVRHRAIDDLKAELIANASLDRRPGY